MPAGLDAIREFERKQEAERNQAAADAAGTAKNKADALANRPEFAGLTNPETGELDERFALQKPEDVGVDERGLDKFRSEALREGPSAFANLQQEKLQAEQLGRRDDAASQQAQAQAQAQAQLASSGGLSGGARERLAGGGARDLLRQRQDISRQGQLSRLDIAGQDEGRRVDQLGRLPGMELQRASLDERNLGRNLEVERLNKGALAGDVKAKGQFELDLFKERMKSFGTERTAQAQEKAAKGSGGKK